MKLESLIVIVVAELAISSSALNVINNFGVKNGGIPESEVVDAFRSDTTLKFMRKLHKQPDQIASNMKDGMKDLQKGPNHDSKKAQKAADKVAMKEGEQNLKKEEKVSKSGEKGEQPNKYAEANKAVTDGGQPAVDGVTEKKSEPEAIPSFDKAMDKLAGTKSGHGYAPGTKPEAETPKAEKDVKKVENKAKEPAEEPSSVPGCKNTKGWEDAKGKDCEDYAEGEFCTRHGGYGDAWLDEWGTFEEVAQNGESAKEACCVCGGGSKDKKEEPAADEEPAAEEPAAEEPAAAGGAPSPAAGPAPAPGPAGDVLKSMKIIPLQAQGFEGEDVMHKDQDTMTSDWGREFGPRAGHKDVKTICAENPENEWCLLHGFGAKPDKNAAALLKPAAMAIFATMLLVCLQ